MNRAKAEFFDSQIHEPWAEAVFNADETAKINRMLEQARLSEGMRVLEPGCGTGRLTVILADIVGPAGHILALDISSKMVEAARLRIGARNNVLLRQGAVEDYSLTPNSFDAVICHNTFPHFDDKPALVSYLATGLKKGGRFIVSHFMNSEWINDLHRKTHPSVLNDCIPNEVEMKKLFRDGGFQVESLRDDESGYLLCAIRL